MKKILFSFLFLIFSSCGTYYITQDDVVFHFLYPLKTKKFGIPIASLTIYNNTTYFLLVEISSDIKGGILHPLSYKEGKVIIPNNNSLTLSYNVFVREGKLRRLDILIRPVNYKGDVIQSLKYSWWVHDGWWVAYTHQIIVVEVKGSRIEFFLK